MTGYEEVTAAGGLTDPGRPMSSLPIAQLFQLSVYWFGINAVWARSTG